MLITFKSHAAQDLIRKLEAAVLDAKKVHPADTTVHPGQDDERDEEPLHLGQRAYPFLDMLRQSEKEGTDVMWGV